MHGSAQRGPASLGGRGIDECWQRADQRGDQHQPAGIEQERNPCGQREQPCAQGLRDQAPSKRRRGLQPSVGPFQPRTVDQSGQHRRGGVFEDKPGAPHDEKDPVQHRHARVTHEDHGAEHGERDRPGNCCRCHRQPAIHAVYHGAAGQREQHPGKLLRDHQPGYQGRAACDRYRQQRAGYLGDAVTKPRDRSGGPEYAEPAAWLSVRS
jgi:hypothetical protein